MHGTLAGMTSSNPFVSNSHANMDGKLPDDFNKENIDNNPPDLDNEGQPHPALVVYVVDPFSFGEDNCDMLRLANLALLRSFTQIFPQLPNSLKHNIYLQVVSLESIFELTQKRSQSRMSHSMRGLAFSVYSQVQRPMQYVKECKTLTGFGPASAMERFLKDNEQKTQFVRFLYQPAYVLAPPPSKKKASSEIDTFGSNNSDRTSTVLFVNYCLSDDQHWLFATCCDERGEVVRSTVINVDIPNKTRRKKASARRVGLRKLMDWILSVMSMSLVPWRLVVGRIGRIGHGELRGTQQISLIYYYIISQIIFM